MCAKNAKARLRPAAKSLIGSLGDFLTPAVWKQANQARHAPKRSARWRTQPLVMVLLIMTWCCGDSQAERFETAKAFCATCWSKRRHLLRLLPTLPPHALLVMDAGFNGYHQARRLREAGFSFVLRASGKFYSWERPRCSRWRDGIVYYWPDTIKNQGLPPLKLRLLRVRGKKRKDVWLLTNVLDSERLPFDLASRYYRWRWENEGLFRTYKRTLAKVKLMSRSVRLAHREAEGALLATQLLLAQGAYALAATGSKCSQDQADNVKPIRCSARKVLLAIRTEICQRQRRPSFQRLLAKATREQRRRRTPKATRVWPRRTPAKRFKCPIILKMPGGLKAWMQKLERKAA